MKKLTAMIILGLFSQACTPKLETVESKLNEALSQWDRIFSTRPQNQTHLVALVKLQTPAILEDIQVPLNVQSVAPATKKLILERAELISDEQKLFLEEVAKLTSDYQVFYQYRFLLNALAVRVPVEVFEKLKGVANVVSTESTTSFDRPRVMQAANEAETLQLTETSVKFIQGLEAHALGIKGQGLKVGVIDTGVDFTHKMLGGEGTVEAYKAVDPNLPHASFPNSKVVGGIDFVGLEYNAASPDFSKRIPKPDVNPIDEAGHGTHVAGTIAGLGDGVQSYDGVAPEAQIYALKVFGKDGSTSDEVVIGSLEYAMDPNGDLDISDRLDVVNLSLGSSYGSPHILYNEAISHLAKGGVVVVASAGNSGNNDYITGAPATSDEAISVAASVDNMFHNWKFRAVEFLISGEVVTSEAIEASISKPIADAGDVQGELVYIGLGDKELSPELAAQVKGKIAFIDRGVVTFEDKLNLASNAGAIGVVVANNVDGEPLGMGGDKKIEIPAIMITKSLGDRIKASKAPVTMKFLTNLKIEKPQLIDTLTGFSSKGPRSSDGFIKPDISSPGANIVSADVGQGDKAVRMSGTSMAAPHIAGVAALLRQKHPTLTVQELQSLMMGTAKSIGDADKQNYLISRQGAGRVQILRALDSALVSNPVSLSLGEQQIDQSKAFLRKIEIKNISGADLSANLEFTGHPAMKIEMISELKLKSNEVQQLELVVRIDASKLTDANTEVDGLILVKKDSVEIHRIPVLAMAHRVADVRVEEALVDSSLLGSHGALVNVKMKNHSAVQAEALVFNLIDIDARKEDLFHDRFRNRQCDLQASGYRIVQRKNQNNQDVSILQVAVKLFEPMTTWNTCEVNLQIDSNGDGLADQEVAGVPQEKIPPLSATTFASVLLDANVARQIRKDFEALVMQNPPVEKEPKEDYEKAILGLSSMNLFSYSTLGIVEVELKQLKLRPTGELAIKVSTTHVDTGAIEVFDYLADQKNIWKQITVSPEGPAFLGMPESIKLAPGETKNIRMTKGYGKEDLIVFFPQNEIIRGSLLTDRQMNIPLMKYQAK